MESIKRYTFNGLYNKIIGKKVHFTSDCEFFPNFNVTGRVINITNNGSEYIMKCILNTGRTIDIGSNMRNLKFELIS